MKTSRAPHSIMQVVLMQALHTAVNRQADCLDGGLM